LRYRLGAIEKMTMGLELRVAKTAVDVAVVRELWREYWQSFDLPIDFQGFGAELESLPGVYGVEGGVLLLSRYNNEPAGTIALRRLDPKSGEVKRLYLRRQFRGLGLGRRLLEAIVDRAAALGYQCLFADTLPSMTDALRLYERAGFGRVEAYSRSPTPGAIYMKLELVKPGARGPSGVL
jgi:putative acetyltransferase